MPRRLRRLPRCRPSSRAASGSVTARSFPFAFNFPDAHHVPVSRAPCTALLRLSLPPTISFDNSNSYCTVHPRLEHTGLDAASEAFIFSLTTPGSPLSRTKSGLSGGLDPLPRPPLVGDSTRSLSGAELLCPHDSVPVGCTSLNVCGYLSLHALHAN